MSESNNDMFGKLDFTPDKGLSLKIIEVAELGENTNVLVFSKADESSFKIVKGLFRIITNKDGKLTIEELKDELGDEKIRKALAHSLVEMNKEAIIEQSLIVTEKALSRKSVGQLKRFFGKRKEGHKLEMKTKVGCVYLAIGGEECVL